MPQVCGKPRSHFFHAAAQRVLKGPRVIHHLLDLHGRDVAWVNTADPTTLGMHLKHDLSRPFMTVGEYALKNIDDKLHRCVVIVVHEHLPHGRRLGFRRTLLQFGSAPRSTGIALIL